jgi:hypothetical protein
VFAKFRNGSIGLIAAAAVVAILVPPDGAQDQPPAAPAAPLVLENSGKPMAPPIQCTLEDIQQSGLSCSEDDPCPVYLELSAVESLGTRIFAAGNLHTSSVTLFSVLLASDDSGHTWREPTDRIRGAGLDHIQFLDSETGWVSGEVLFPLPQDPFVLVTSDGGKTWRKREVFGESRESRFGSILQLSFAAKNSGSLIVDRGHGSDGDRYEVYESPDGGDSWNVKETNNKLPKLRQPAPSPEWRLRADGPTQSYRIERRQGARFTNVAAFAVKTGVCKPPQPAEDDTAGAPTPPLIKKQ